MQKTLEEYEAEAKDAVAQKDWAAVASLYSTIGEILAEQDKEEASADPDA